MKPGVVVWITGLPSSGKSTLAWRVAEGLWAEARETVLLDGDDVRAALVPPPAYDDHARADFYATLANLAALLARQGFVVLVPATAHERAMRAQARAVAPRFLEVYVDTPLRECAERDPKRLYAKARVGEIENLPGVGAEYERPLHPDVIARAGRDEAAVQRILALLQSPEPSSVSSSTPTLSKHSTQ
jgi:adenylylsulfate kinase